jgi:hypothetical protein
MPSARLTIIVRLDQAASLARLEDFHEERQAPIGTDVSVLLSADDGPTVTKLFTDLGAVAIPYEATATIGGIHYLVAGDGNQMSVVEAGHPHRRVWPNRLDVATAPRTRTASGNTNGTAVSWTGSAIP